MGYKNDNKRQKTDSNDTINNLKTYITNVTSRNDLNEEIITKPFNNTTNTHNEYNENNIDKAPDNINNDNIDKKNKNKKKKRKKKKKIESKSNETVTVINSNDSAIKTTTNNDKLINIINDITEYLNDWFNQLDWKFSKKLQHCLITNCLNGETVNDELFKLFVEYSVTIAGNAKERLLSMANDTLAKHLEDDDRESDIVYIRAKQLIEKLTNN